MTKLDNFRQIIKDCFPDDIHSEEELMQYIKKHLQNDTHTYIQPEDFNDIIVCIYECYDIDGYSISELPKTSQLNPQTLFNASNDASQPSMNIAYEQLSTQICNDVSSELKKNGELESMAYESKSEYASIDHNHDKLYTADFSFKNSPFIDQMLEDPESELCALAQLSVQHYFTETASDGTQQSKKIEPAEVYKLYCPKIKYPAPTFYGPAIGELKFMPVSELQALYDGKLKNYGDKLNVDIYADDFDGWVFPNGTTFTCSSGDFAEAAAAFGSSTKFTVPQLDSFLYAITKDTELQPLQHVQQRCLVGPHSHGISVKNASANVSISDVKTNSLLVTTSSIDSEPIPSDSIGTAAAYFGNSYYIVEKELPGPYSMKIDFSPTNAISIDMHTAKSAPTDKEYRPACRLMPVLMYIGPKQHNVIQSD